MIRAWWTEMWDVCSIVAADSRAQAAMATRRAAREAGYLVKPLERVRVLRFPEKDFWAQTAPKGRCYCPEAI